MTGQHHTEAFHVVEGDCLDSAQWSAMPRGARREITSEPLALAGV
ncbi:MAG: hypothetical protein ACRDYA_16940 [Egibacteraceae bacterium]